MENVNITKASGVKVPFSLDKLHQSLRKSGAKETLINEVLNEIKNVIYEGIPTKKIYKLAYKMLRKASCPSAAKYKLKNAIMELGPSGFPFEKYIAAILNHQGYSIKVGQFIQGHCVTHEIDVVAEKEDRLFMIECKFHNSTGYVCDVKIPLYIQSRFKDVEQESKKIPGNGTKFHQGWVVTNTKFSTDAIQYGLCSGLHLLGWDFPANESLREMIDNSKLYPITCLTTLTHNEKEILLNKKIVLCLELINHAELLDVLQLPLERRINVRNELRELCDSFGER